MIGLTEVRATVAAALAIQTDDIDDSTDLISLGLDSLRMMKIAGGWRKQGHDVNFAQLAADPTVAAWAAMLLGDEPTETEVVRAADGRSIPGEPFALAPMQHAYWIGRSPGQELGGVAAHLYVEFDGGDTDPVALRRAVGRLIEIHPMLRAQFLPDGTERIMPPSERPNPLAVVDLRTPAGVDVRRELEILRERKSHQVLDVAGGQVVDVTLTLLPHSRSRLHIDLDMLAADAVSYRTLLSDLAVLYRGGEIAAAPYTYQDYLAERAAAPDPARERDRRWWQDKLPTLPSAPALPLIPESQRRDPHRVVRMHHWISPRAKDRLFAAANDRGVTAAMALASVFAGTVARWSGNQRFLLNLPLFERDRRNEYVDRLVGDFSSSILLDVDLTGAGTVVERARQIQATMHANGAHAAYGALDVLRDLARHRGEQVLAPVVYTSAINLGELFDDRVVEAFGDAEWIVSQGPQVLLDAQVTEVRGGLLLNWDVRANAFLPGVIDAMFGQYTAAVDRLTDGVAAWEAESTAQLPVDQRAVRTRVNATSVDTSPRTLHERFFTHARSTPDAAAVVWGTNGQLTYRALADRALAVAGALHDIGIGAGDSVAVHLPKGPDQLLATLGVLAAGATYVPVSIDQPPVRRRQILGTADAAAVLTTTGIDCAESDLPVISITAAADHENPLTQPILGDPEGIAYVLFTSGSTGEPKGVEVPHRAAINTIDDINRRFEVTAADRSITVAAYEFDISVYDYFGMLDVGGAVVAVEAADRGDPTHWATLIRRHDASVLTCVPSALDMLMAVAESAGSSERPLGTTLRVALLGGDTVGVDLPRRLHALVPGVRFAGLGGATETAIHHTVCEVADPPSSWTAVPFGTPLDNVECRIVDASGSDCPDWVAGELLVGGAGVARGYRDRPELTAQRFVRSDSQNWYRTGDLARYRPEGTVEFLGRSDHQVKIRGYRVELGEIEAALQRIPDVHGAVVVTIAGASVGLAAAVITDRGSHLTEESVHAALAGALPAYMIPSRTVVLDSFPLTGNGKIDRSAIVGLIDQHRPGADFVEPSTSLEVALADIVAAVLQIDRAGATDDFFALGGDSVLATTTIARVREWLDAPDVTVADLFATRTVRALATRLTASESDPGRLEQVARIYLDVAALDADDLVRAVS